MHRGAALEHWSKDSILVPGPGCNDLTAEVDLAKEGSKTVPEEFDNLNTIDDLQDTEKKR